MKIQYSFYALILSFICILTTNLYAVSEYVPDEDEKLTEAWRWKHFEYFDGKGFIDFTETENNVMYFALKDALVSYDGYNWNSYSYPTYVTGIPTTIKNTKNGIYLSTTEGVYLFKNNQFHIIFKDYTSSVANLVKIHDTLLISNFYRGFALIFEQKVLIVTDSSNFSKVDSLNSDVQKIHLPNTYNNILTAFNGAYINNKNNLVILMKVQTKKQKFQQPWMFELDLSKIFVGKISLNQIPSTKAVKYGKRTFIQNIHKEIYIVSEENWNGISSFDGKKWSHKNLESKKGISNICSAIEKIANNKLIIGGKGYLLLSDTGDFKVLSYPRIPISTSARQKVLVTHNGNLWIGGIDSKVFFVNHSDSRFKTYKNLVYQGESANGDKWFIDKFNKVIVSTDTGMFQYDTGDGLMQFPGKIIITSKDEVWCAGSQVINKKYIFRGAVAQFKDGRWNLTIENTAFKGVNQKSFYEDKYERLWIGALDKGRFGTFRITKNEINKGVWENYINIEEVPTGFAEANNGMLYAGNYNYVYTFDQQDSNWIPIKNLTTPTSITSYSNNHPLWVGTRGIGLIKYNGQILDTFNYKNKLKSNVIYNVHSDTDSTLWVATDQDITRFDGNTWINFSLPQQFILSSESGDIKTDGNNNVWINQVNYQWAFRVVHLKKTSDNIQDFYCYRFIPDSISPESRIVHYSKVVDKNGNTLVSWEGNDYYETTSRSELLFSYKLNNNDWSEFENSTSYTFTGLKSGDYTFYLRAKDKDGNMEKSPSQVSFKVLPPIWKQAWFISLISFFVLTVIYLISRIVVRNKKLNASNLKLQSQKEEIQQQSEEISAQRDNLKERNEEINAKNMAINESINYAKSIQNAFMPTQGHLNKFMDCFVLFKPKDIVSGDFTWFSAIEKDESKPLKAFICVADCTGHGVPGALVSMVGNNLLHETINLMGEYNPAQVLEMVNVGFQLALKQDETRNNDGMDMALVLLEENGNEQEHESEIGVGKTQDLPASPSPELQGSEAGSHSNSKLNAQLDRDNAKPNSRNIKLTFAGAKNPCVIYRAKTGELEIFKGSRKSIGGLRAKRSKEFYEKNETVLQKGDVIYLFSDGIIDQHNLQRERYTREKLLQLFTKIGNKNTEEQKQLIEKEITQHMQNEKQTDDISLIGIKI